jgi:DNA modification methylase
MTPEQFQQFLLATCSGDRRIAKPGASMYVCHSSSWQREFQNALEAAGFEARCQIIWAKNTFAWGFGRYKFQHEPIFCCHVAGQKSAWYGDKSQSTLSEEEKPAANRIQPNRAGARRGSDRPEICRLHRSLVAGVKGLVPTRQKMILIFIFRIPRASPGGA